MFDADCSIAKHTVQDALLGGEGLPTVRRRIHPAVYVTAFSMVIRLAWAAWANVTPVSDFSGYDVLAKQLLKEGTFVHSMGYAYRTPGYPLYLALIYAVFGPSWKIVGLANAVIGGVTSGLVVLLASKTISMRASVMAGLLHGISINSVVYVPVLASENLGVFLMVASLAALASSHEASGFRRYALGFLSGVSLSVLVLTRPAGGTLTAPMVGLLALYHPHRRTWSIGILLAFLAGAGGTFMPWSIRNYRLGLSPLTVSTQSGVALWWDVHPYVYPGRPFTLPPGSEKMNEQGRSDICREWAVRWVREHPREYVEMCRSRFVRAFGASPDCFAAMYLVPTKENDESILAGERARSGKNDQDTETRRQYYSTVQRRQDYVLRPYHVVMAPLLLAAVLLSLPRWRAFSFALLPALCYLGLLIVTVFIERYRCISDTLLYIPLGALLSDVLLGTRDLGGRLPRVGKILFALGLVGTSMWVHVSGRAVAWYLPPTPYYGNPDVSNLRFARIPLSDPVESYIVAWWASRGTSVTQESGGLRCRIAGAGGSDGERTGGIRLPVYEPEAIRLDMTLVNPDRMLSLYVDALDNAGHLVHRWVWSDVNRARADEARRSYVFVPGKQVGSFQISGSTRLDGVREVRVSARVSAKSVAGFMLHQAEIALPELPDPDVSWYRFGPVEPEKRPSEHASSWNRGLATVTIERTDRGLRFHGAAAGGTGGGRYGGLRFASPQAEAFRLGMRFENPENIEAVYVDAYAPARELRSRWVWECHPYNRPSSESGTFAFVPGEGVGFFKAEPAASLADVCEFHIFIRMSRGREAGFVVESVETGHQIADPASFTFGAVPLEADPSRHLSEWNHRTESVRVELVENGLKCQIEGSSDTSAGQYGGIRFDASDPAAIRFNLTLTDPSLIEELYVEAVGQPKGRAARWQWRPDAAGRRCAKPIRCTLIRNGLSGLFQQTECDEKVPIRRIEVFARIKPGSKTSFVMENIEVGRAAGR